MAIKQFNARIGMKRDTAANWEQNNPVLLNGEIIIVDTASGEVRFKVGDGTKLYKQLPFSDEAVRALISDKSLGITSASVGQLIKVQEVDGDGKPTKWKAVDMAGAWYVTVTQTSSFPSTAATADKTPQEILAAYQAGYAVYARVNFVGIPTPQILPLVSEPSSTSEGDVIALMFTVAGQAETNGDAGIVAAVYMSGVWNVWKTNLAKFDDIPTKTSELTNDSKFINFTEIGDIDNIATV